MHDEPRVEPRSAENLAGYVGPLVNYVCRRLRYYEAIGDLQPTDLQPEDIVDLIYLEAGEHLRHSPPGEPGYRWLRSLADRILAREVRRIRTEHAAADIRSAPETPPERRLPELIPDSRAPVPEEVAVGNELQRSLARLVGEFPDSLREPFLLMVVDGYGRKDIAAMEGLPPDEVTRRVAQAIRVLRDRLAEEYADQDAPPPEQLFRLVERLSPTAVAAARARQHLIERGGLEPPATT
jgi:DNA-directed RNA polymerase specialized sigma24 family protein